MNPSPPPSSHSREAPLVSCEAIQALLVDYYTHELGPHRSDLVREHLRRCPACQAAAADLAATLELLKEASKDGPPIPHRLSAQRRDQLRWAIAHPIRDWIHRHHKGISLLVTGFTLLALLIALRRCGVWKREDRELLPPVQIGPAPSDEANR